MRVSACLLVSLAVLVGAAGCSRDEGGEGATQATTEQTAPNAPAADGPIIEVSADKTHAVQPGDEITLTVSVSNFTLDAARMGQDNENGVGHYSVHLDESGEALLTDGAATTKVVIPESITDGSHDLRVVLHNNDGTPLSPGVQSSVTLIVYRL